MKTAFTFFSFLIITALTAQPTITSNWAPNIGDMVEDVVGLNANLLEPGNDGANANWDYSNVMQDPNVPVAGFEFADPSVSDFANLFPTSNIAIVVSGIDPNTLPTTFYKKSSDQIELLGNALPMVSFIYSDPQVLMKFPFSYGDSFEDDFMAINDIIGIINEVDGQVTVTADAYGTIKTPKGTYSDVIRVKTESYKKDSTGLGAGSYNLVIEDIVNYSWYKNTVGHNIASLTITNGMTMTVAAGQVFGDTLMENRSFSWNNSTGTATFEEVSGTLPFDINSYGPNPVNDYFKINLNAECNCPLKMELINSLGQIIKSEQFDLFYGNNDLNISMADIPAGNYFIKLNSENAFGVFQVQKIK